MSENTSFRFLHTMIRVLDLEKSIDFYSRHLGMKLLRKNDYPSSYVCREKSGHVSLTGWGCIGG